MTSEADTCRKFVLPKLYAAGWTDDQICEQRTFTDGRIMVTGKKAWRRPQKRADYLLRYTRDLILAVVEAKPAYKKPADGLQQAKDYAKTLGLKFAYATNGLEIVEFDFITGRESAVTAFPSAAELWTRLRTAEKMTDDAAAERLLAPFNLTTGKEPRYYQRIAIHRAIHAMLQGQRRVLLTMATGTGKTVVAFQICWKLWSSKWNAKADPTRKPRILYLADRNFLVDGPKDKIFAPFGDARWKIEGGIVTLGREMYFATYQSIASTTGSAQPTVPLRAIRELPIPVPSLPEQRRIVAELDALQAEVDRLKALQAETAAELDALLPAILDRAFKGEL